MSEKVSNRDELYYTVQYTEGADESTIDYCECDRTVENVPDPCAVKSHLLRISHSHSHSPLPAIAQQEIKKYKRYTNKAIVCGVCVAFR